MIASPPQPAPLLDSLLRSGFSLPHAIAQLNLSATDLLAAADHPHLESIATLARHLTELHTLHIQTTALETLVRVCKDSPNLVHARLAATAILRYNPTRTPRRTPSPRGPTQPTPPTTDRTPPISDRTQGLQSLRSPAAHNSAPAATPSPRSRPTGSQNNTPADQFLRRAQRRSSACRAQLKPSGPPLLESRILNLESPSPPASPLPLHPSIPPAFHLRFRAGAAPLRADSRTTTPDPLLARLAAMTATSGARPP